MKGRSFHISIGTGIDPTPDPKVLGGVSLEHDLRLVKAALLYADDVTLYSPAASMLLSIHGIKKLRPDEKLAFLEEFVPYAIGDKQQADGLRQNLRLLRLAQRDRYAPRDVRELVGSLERVMEWDEICAVADRQLQESQAIGLVTAIKKGRLHVHDFLKARGQSKTQSAAELIGQAGLSKEQRQAGRWGDDVIREYMRVMNQAVSNSWTYPLFDEEIGGIVSAGVREGAITVSEAGMTRGKHISLAADLLERLPLFDRATVDEVLDIRRELDKPLVRFRKAIVNFSHTIKAAPWDQEFMTEADTIFHRDIAPAVEEVEELVRSNRYLLLLLKRIGIPSAGALTAVVSRLADIPEIIAHTVNNPAAANTIASTVTGGAALAAGKAVRDTAWERYQNQQSIEQRELYFYYRARKRLS